MKESEALRIVKFFNTAFPRDTLETDSAVLYAQEIALLADAGIGEKAARECARSLDRFPSIKEFRQAYHSISNREYQERMAAERALEPPADPETREEIGRMIAETATKLAAPEAVGENQPEQMGKGQCEDCGHDGDIWTFGTSGRMLCGSCCTSRLRAAEMTV